MKKKKCGAKLPVTTLAAVHNEGTGFKHANASV